MRDFSKTFSLYSPKGARKYLNREEHKRAIAVMHALPPEQALFSLVLTWTGARVSEVLALTPSAIDIEAGFIAFRTLKRRGLHIREVPLPPWLSTALEKHFKLSARRRDPQCAGARLWPWHRSTAWRLIKSVMDRAFVAGRQACPRGLRHAFGIGTLQAGVPINRTQYWLGHARISTTAIYTVAIGPEDRAFAERFWRHHHEGWMLRFWLRCKAAWTHYHAAGTNR